MISTFEKRIDCYKYLFVLIDATINLLLRETETFFFSLFIQELKWAEFPTIGLKTVIISSFLINFTIYKATP